MYCNGQIVHNLKTNKPTKLGNTGGSIFWGEARETTHYEFVNIRKLFITFNPEKRIEDGHHVTSQKMYHIYFRKGEKAQIPKGAKIFQNTPEGDDAGIYTGCINTENLQGLQLKGKIPKREITQAEYLLKQGIIKPYTEQTTEEKKEKEREHLRKTIKRIKQDIKQRKESIKELQDKIIKL